MNTEKNKKETDKKRVFEKAQILNNTSSQNSHSKETDFFSQINTSSAFQSGASFLTKAFLTKFLPSIIIYSLIILLIVSGLIWFFFTFLWTWLAWILTFIILSPFFGIISFAFKVWKNKK